MPPRLSVSGYAIEHVPAQRSFGDVEAVEVVGGVSGHAEALHDGLGAEGRGARQGADLLGADAPEPIAEGGAGCLGGVAVAPGRADEPPADLDGGGERGVEGDVLDAGHPDELTRGANLQSPEGVAVGLQALLVAV